MKSRSTGFPSVLGGNAMKVRRAYTMPIGGLVPFKGELAKISSCRFGAQGEELYELSVGGAWVARQTHTDLLRGIRNSAVFEVGYVGPINSKGLNYRVWDRRWSFRKGEVIYYMGDVKKRIIIRPFTQNALIRAEAARRRRYAVRDTLPDDECLVGWDSQSGW